MMARCKLGAIWPTCSTLPTKLRKNAATSSSHRKCFARGLRRQSETGRLLKQHGVARAPLEQAINAVRGAGSVDSAESEGQRESLKKYTIDLTERARQGKLDPVIGRDDEIRRAIQVLQRRHKNNPVVDWRAGRGQDRHCRRAGAAHRQWRSAGITQG